MIGVLGHRGFIGKHLCDVLGHENVLTYDGSICQPNKELSDFVKSCDTVVNLAGKNRGTSQELIETNVYGALTIANICLENDKYFIHAGTIYDKTDTYRASKDIATYGITQLNKIGLKFSIAKIPKVFGPGCKPFYNSFISTIIHCHAKNIPYKHLISDFNAKLELVYIDDLTQQLKELTQRSDKYQDNTLIFLTRHCLYFTIQEIVDILENGYVCRGSDKILTTLKSYA
jgi:UDP-2-acetamido-2,6-beta-L-arabino-hexul-4-ose reductase